MLKSEYLLHEKTWEKLIESGITMEYETGEIIFLQDQPSQRLVCLKRGRIKTCIFFPNGKEKLLSILEAPCVFSIIPIIDGGMSTFSSIALSETEIVFIPEGKTHVFLLENPDLNMLFMRIMAQEFRWIHMQADAMLFSIPRRLACVLLNYNDYGILPHECSEKKLIITHDDLANLLGTTRQLITKYLNEFSRMGFIEKGRNYVIIRNYEELKKFSEADTKKEQKDNP